MTVRLKVFERNYCTPDDMGGEYDWCAYDIDLRDKLLTELKMLILSDEINNKTLIKIPKTEAKLRADYLIRSVEINYLIDFLTDLIEPTEEELK